MRTHLLIAALLLGACRQGQGDDVTANQAAAPAAQPNGEAPGAAPSAADGGWDLQSSGEGTALVLAARNGETLIRLFCASGAGQLLVNVPAFEPIGSEERLSFGGGGDAVALVAETRGDRQRGGVSGSGQTPANLAALLSGQVSASYGAQTSGPHPAPPPEQARALVTSCNEAGPGQQPEPQPNPKSQPAHPCHSQDGRTLPPMNLRAIGTEPFWGAHIDGRCVTYSHPEDQKGTRVWTKFSGSTEQGRWSGSLGGQPFVLRTRPQQGCSDGMSDRRYPIAVTVTVSGEQRRGCAHRL